MCDIVNRVWQYSMVWYGMKEEVIRKEGGYGLITAHYLTKVGIELLAASLKRGLGN